jgi:hypothetical protein
MRERKQEKEPLDYGIDLTVFCGRKEGMKEVWAGEVSDCNEALRACHLG